MKIYETSVVSYHPKKVQSLGMDSTGFPLVDGEPQDMNDNNFYELDGKLYLYDGEDDWSPAIEGIHYSTKNEVMNIIKIRKEFYGTKEEVIIKDYEPFE